MNVPHAEKSDYERGFDSCTYGDPFEEEETEEWQKGYGDTYQAIMYLMWTNLEGGSKR